MTENKFKSNYPTDKYSRVELLFYNGSDINQPTNKIGARIFACPAGDATKHTSNGPPKCPLWYANNLYANYIDPEKDLKSTAYHLSFTYMDKVKVKNKKPTVQKAPAGLTIEAYHYKKVGAKWQKLPINSITKFSDGVYTVQVDDSLRRGTTCISNSARNPRRVPTRRNGSSPRRPIPPRASSRKRRPT